MGKENAERVLVYVLDQILRLLHPFMPFITEEIWQAIPHEGDTLICSKWPTYSDALAFPEEEAAMESIMNAIRAVRNRRAEMNVAPSRKCTLYVTTDKTDIFSAGEAYICRLAYADSLVVSLDAPEGHEDMAECVTTDAKLFLPLNQLVDVDKELARINKEADNAQKNLDRINLKLGNPGFLAKAPEQVVAAERDRAEKLSQMLAQLAESRARLEKLKK